jgi:hypothetical protein
LEEAQAQAEIYVRNWVSTIMAQWLIPLYQQEKNPVLDWHENEEQGYWAILSVDGAEIAIYDIEKTLRGFALMVDYERHSTNADPEKLKINAAIHAVGLMREAGWRPIGEVTE